MKITQEYLKSILDYNARTGLFKWKRRHDCSSHWNGRWSGKNAGWLDAKKGYLEIGINNKKYYAHRLAWLYITGEWPKEVDHKNGVKSNNRFSNLRPSSHIDNQRNKGLTKRNSSGYKGVFFCNQKKKYVARIIIDNKRSIHLGSFTNPKVAHLAYCQAAKKYHGEFARVA
jgi:HNH endonuclease/AP2 domain